MVRRLAPILFVAACADGVAVTDDAVSTPPGLAERVTLGEVPVTGGTIVRLEQRLDGLPIFEGELRALVPASGKGTVAPRGRVFAATTPRSAKRFTDDDASALRRAVVRTYGSELGVDVGDAKIERGWFAEGERLIAAVRVEAYSTRNGVTRLYETMLAGEDGRVLRQRSLTAEEAFDYRVWAHEDGSGIDAGKPLDGPIADYSPHPTGVPDKSYPGYVPPPLVRMDGTPDPWLPGTATETTGNNVDAYVDVNEPDGLTDGDFRATTTAPRVFDRTYDVEAEPMVSVDQQMAATTMLFYASNWLHDFWYAAGFTEAAGNAQVSNFGRGGVEGDPLLVEAQDKANSGARNNANMSTPSDGMSPKMQVFLWTGKDERRLTLTPALATTPDVGAAAFGPRDFDLTGTVVAGNPADGCAPQVGNVTGRIVLVARGECQFETKALNIQNSGGAAMLMLDNVDSDVPPGMSDGDNQVPITIPSLSLRKADGEALRTRIAGTPTTAAMFRLSGPEGDGSLDNTVIAHEFGHYLHHRLTNCGNAICGGMSEGWGDFVGLMMQAEAGDNFATGTFAIGQYATQSGSDPGYFGIRRAPYSVDFRKNSLTLRHIVDGEPLPTDIPFRGGGNNAQVHNTGEVWSSMLWEGFVALLGTYPTFEAGRAAMAQYVVSGLLLTPTDGSITQARDAILEAARAAKPADHDTLAAAFARRGFGSCAVAPPVTSTTFTGTVESFEVKGRIEPAVTATSLTDNVVACDEDNILDANETARITVTVRNPGPLDVANVTIELVSDLDGVSVTSQPVTLANFPAYTNTPFTAEVALGDVSGAIAGNLAVQISAADTCSPVLSVPVAARFNVDDSPNTATTDTFDAISTWSGGPAGTWRQERPAPLEGHWLGVGPSVSGDSILISPELEAGDGDLTIEYEQRYAFETANGNNYDGGVVEISSDNGQTWEDVVNFFPEMPYTGGIHEVESSNPLAGRQGFVGKNDAYPERETIRIELGRALAGETFRLRFRLGSDNGTGSEGWLVDNVAVTGLVGKPFTSQVPDNGDCEGGPAQPGDGDDGGCCQANTESGATSGLLSLGVIGLAIRRRRRR